MQVRLRFKDQTFQISYRRFNLIEGGMLKITHVSDNYERFNCFTGYEMYISQGGYNVVIVNATEFLTSIVANWP